jgi:hypothetical protein
MMLWFAPVLTPDQADGLVGAVLNDLSLTGSKANLFR